jgi:hypothetical protein
MSSCYAVSVKGSLNTWAKGSESLLGFNPGAKGSSVSPRLYTRAEGSESLPGIKCLCVVSAQWTHCHLVE